MLLYYYLTVNFVQITIRLPEVTFMKIIQNWFIPESLKERWKASWLKEKEAPADYYFSRTFYNNLQCQGFYFKGKVKQQITKNIQKKFEVIRNLSKRKSEFMNLYFLAQK